VILKKSSTKTNGKVYFYKKWNVHHSQRTEHQWCYLNSGHLDIAGVKSIIGEAAQKVAQNHSVIAQTQNNCFSRVFHGNNGFSVEPGMGFEPIYSESADSEIAQTFGDVGKVIGDFQEYCVVDERLARVVGKDYKNIARRFLEHTKGVISRESIRSYLNTYLNKSPKTYNNQLDGLRAFIIRFMRQPALMSGFKKAHVDFYDYDTELPTKEQLQMGFNALKDVRERAVFLLYATTGLRKTELWKLTFSEVDFDSRCIRSRHNTRTKKAGITFYNEEAEGYLKLYLQTRKDNKPRLIRIDNISFANIWKRASDASGCYIRSQVLRKWHSTMLGELGIPDRYVDIFQGRAPRSVLAKHYTGKGLERLKRIYDKASLKVLC
jgi:integrase